MQFCRLLQEELNIAYETAYFGPCPCCINIDKSNYPEGTELDTNPSQTLSPHHHPTRTTPPPPNCNVILIMSHATIALGTISEGGESL